MTGYTVQFWIRHRGRQDVRFSLFPAPAYDLPGIGAWIVETALRQYDARWPGARKDELHVVGIREAMTGREVLSMDQPWYSEYLKRDNRPFPRMIPEARP